MHREFLHAIAQVQPAEVAGPDEAAAGRHDELAAALEQRDAHVIHVGAEDVPGAAHTNVVCGVGAVATGAMSAQQVIPAVASHQSGGFHVDRDVHRLVAGDALSRLRIELNDANVAEIGSVTQPQPASGGIEQESGVDGIAVLNSVG